ncbi:MAG TPA: hypothetical protein PKY10_04255, partial [Lentisphaeria bacterium]|nr:hypothetical protein [Lentisphaeria bacterium]
MMRKRFLLCLSLLLAYAGVPVLHADVLMLLDFENPQQAASFVTLEDNANFVMQNTEPQYVKSGKASAHVFMPKAGTGEHRWPRAVYTLPKNQRDWSAYDELHYSFYNPMSQSGRIGLSILDEDGISYPNYGANLEPGWNEFIWPLPDVVREKEIKGLRFIISDSPIDRVFYVDDIRLVVTQESVNEKLKALKQRMLREAPDEFWQRAGAEKKLLALHQELQTLQESTEAPIVRSAKTLQFFARYLSEKDELWRILCLQNQQAFDEIFPAKEGGLGYACALGYQKVYRDSLPFYGKIGGRLRVSLARREREGVQLILRSRKKLEQIRVSVMPLQREAMNDAVPEITPLLVGHVKTPKPNYSVEKVTWRPDPLLPYAEDFPLDANVWQAIWLDVKVPPACRAGDYSTMVIVEKEGKEEKPLLKVPLDIHVWNFELPAFPTQPSLVNFHSDSDIATYIPRERRQAVADEFIAYRRGKKDFNTLGDEAKMLREMEIATEMLLLEHNVTPAPLYDTHRRLKAEDVRRWRSNGGKYFSLTYLPPKKAKRGEPFAPWVQNMVLNNLKATMAALEPEGLLDEAWCYGFDEIKEDKFFAAKTLMEAVKKNYPNLKIITTTEDPDFGKTNGLDKLVDAWCPQIERFTAQMDKVREVQKEGKKVWFYSCCYDPGIDMLIEKSLTSARLLCGLAQIKYQADGFLYYSVISGNRHQELITGGPLTVHTGN